MAILKGQYDTLIADHAELTRQINLHITYLEMMEQGVKPDAAVESVETDGTILKGRLYHQGRKGHGWDLVVITQHNDGIILPWSSLLLNYEQEETVHLAWAPIRNMMRKLEPAVLSIRDVDYYVRR
jgi:hypothetical protein